MMCIEIRKVHKQTQLIGAGRGGAQSAHLCNQIFLKNQNSYDSDLTLNKIQLLYIL